MDIVHLQNNFVPTHFSAIDNTKSKKIGKEKQEVA
jgi:hypothetical protein